MFGLGFQELLVLFIIALLLFGAKRLPDVGRSLGTTIREFKKALQEGEKGTGPAPDNGEKKAS